MNANTVEWIIAIVLVALFLFALPMFLALAVGYTLVMFVMWGLSRPGHH